jgi:phage N-6-adenine-methyltransferase
MVPSETSLDAFNSGEAPTATKEEATDDEEGGSDEYGTPRWLVRALLGAIGGLFGLDPAAGAEPMQIGETRFTKADDGLSKSWTGVDSIYLNPPYSNPEPWLRKFANTFAAPEAKRPEFGVALTKTDTSTEWFQQYLIQGTVYCFPDERLSFFGAGNDADFPNMFTVFGEPPEALLDELASMGALFSQVEVQNALDQQRLDDLVNDGGIAAAPIPVSQLALGTSPAAPTVGETSQDVSLEVFHPHDDLTLRFDTDGLGAPDIPEEVTVTVLPNGKTVEAATGAIVLDAIGKATDGTQVCVALRNSAALVSQLEVSIAVGKDRWTLATPKTIVRH